MCGSTENPFGEKGRGKEGVLQRDAEGSVSRGLQMENELPLAVESFVVLGSHVLRLGYTFSS